MRAKEDGKGRKEVKKKREVEKRMGEKVEG